MNYIRTIVLSLITLYTSPTISETLVIGGSGADLATFKLLAKAYKQDNKQAHLKVLPSIGSSGGIKAVQNNKIDLCLTSRAPKDKERSADLIFSHYAKTPFVFAVNPSIDIDNLTSQDVLDIYSGKMQHWPNNLQVKPILRPSNDSDIQLLINNLPGFDQAISMAYKRRGLPVATTDQDVIELINNLKGTIGGSTMSIITTEKKQIKALKLNGVSPSPENIKNKTYTLYKDLYICHNKANSSKFLDQFIEFISSEKGKKILNETGHYNIEY